MPKSHNMDVGRLCRPDPNSMYLFGKGIDFRAYVFACAGTKLTVAARKPKNTSDGEAHSPGVFLLAFVIIEVPHRELCAAWGVPNDVY
jgi:hypothetical protein